jgi:S-adenosylmethionine:tRNA ribosyltransferase-isomerase
LPGIRPVIYRFLPFFTVLTRSVNSFAHIFPQSYPHLIHRLLFTPSPGHGLLEPVRAADFDYSLPDELIAQHPAPQRDASRLLVLNRADSSITHTRFPALLEYLRDGDVLILNDSRVFNARLRGVNKKSGGEFEVLLLTQNALNDWWVMLRPGKRARVGTEIVFKNPEGKLTAVSARVSDTNEEGHRRLEFFGTPDIFHELDRLGEVPLPPYIQRAAGKEMPEDMVRYQTVYAKTKGSVAAPTAGLHFTENFLEQIRSKGVHVHYATLHVGVGTFAPVKADHLDDHVMHCEKFFVPKETAAAFNAARKEKRRVIAVGTTPVRVLETLAASSPITDNRSLIASQITGETNIFIYPPFRFQSIDALLTNFHLPRSTLLMLVSAFAAPGETRGRELVVKAYAEAIAQKYRFYSYGDAMLIV